MASSGQKTSTNPAAKFSFLSSKREKLREELRNMEKQVYEMETTYLQESNYFWKSLKGVDGAFSSSNNGTGLKKSRKLQPEDRIFSSSSVTSPTVVEVGREDAGSAKSKGGRMPTNGPGKPRKGRLAPRDGKRIKLSRNQVVDHSEGTPS